MKKWFAFGLIGIGLLAVSGCSGDDDVSRRKVSLLFAEMMADQRIFIDDNGMLELWAVKRNEYNSLGQFRIDFNGRPVDLDGNLIEHFESDFDLLDAARLVVTFESSSAGLNTGDGTGPEIMSGMITGNSFDLDNGAAFQGVLGQYLVVTPSDGGGTPDVEEEDSTNPNCGIWFTTRDWGKPGPGLGLPVAPEGWIYEGWLMHGPMEFLSMGQFDSISVLDHNNIYLSSEQRLYAESTYHFPGEDFLVNAPEGLTFPFDVRGSMTFVTMEPVPDNAPDDPFMIMTLFCKSIPMEIQTSTKSMPLDAPPLPHATATLK
jgi:hypothetical protein